MYLFEKLKALTRMNIFNLRISLLVIVVLLLAGCGNTGALELPPDSPAHNAHHPSVKPEYPIDE